MKDNYVLGRPIPRYSAIVERLAKVGRSLEAAGAIQLIVVSKRLISDLESF